MEGERLKEVYFDQFCVSCENLTKKEEENPCDECLGIPCRENTHTPINYKEKQLKRKR